MSKRTVFSILCAVIIGISFTNLPVYAAATPTPTKTLAAVADAEVEREKQLTKELSLNMPDQTEDPNYPITFTDPSKQGVDITVDDKTTTKAPNPFLLPNLAIGEHKIIFKFKTKDGLVRVLSKEILVAPKAPQFDTTLKTEVVKPSSVTLRGTALPQATVMLVINSAKTYKISTTQDGRWEFIVPDPQEGTNNIMAFAIKDGVVSSASKTFAVAYRLAASGSQNPISINPKENPVIQVVNTVIANINTNRVEQPAIFYGAIGVGVVLILIMIDIVLRRKAAKNRDQKTIEALFGTLQKDGGTIVDAIQSSKAKDEKPKKKDSKKAGVKAAETASKVEVTKKESAETQQPAPVTIEKKQKKGAGKFQVQKEQKTETKPIEEVKQEKPITKSEPLESIEEDDDETEEPEKKVLSKEEFLKQFQKGGEQDE